MRRLDATALKDAEQHQQHNHDNGYAEEPGNDGHVNLLENASLETIQLESVGSPAVQACKPVAGRKISDAPVVLYCISTGQHGSDTNKTKQNKTKQNTGQAEAAFS